ncbi:hypothetical protein [Actinomadura rubrisoli]|uniref:Uncharacterized protein n=1 Tax=Actinomadura rubrisoli TaxID=2530368 RepID=A0A4R5B3M0_9ACTN|nr:hypothetical protein [Actinomadura rubrisoli]TDD77712.1 hypothetical protein E1298_29735 [Actinomadura rubrisoli]
MAEVDIDERLREILDDLRHEHGKQGYAIEQINELFAAAVERDAIRSKETDVGRLAEVVYIARQRALGDEDVRAFSSATPRIRTQYLKEAAEVAELLGQDREAELERLRAQVPAPLPDGRLAELSAIKKASTRGPWYREDDFVYAVNPNGPDVRIATVHPITNESGADGDTYANATFIAAAREGLRDALREIKRQAAEVERLRAERDHLEDRWHGEHLPRKQAEAERDRLAEHEHLVRMLHPKIEQPRHGCCAPPSACGGHRPECGGDHGGRWVAWPCSTIRALDDPMIARNRIRHLHKEFRGQDAVESTCLADREPWPCPTIRALDGTEAGR